MWSPCHLFLETKAEFHFISTPHCCSHPDEPGRDRPFNPGWLTKELSAEAVRTEHSCRSPWDPHATPSEVERNLQTLAIASFPNQGHVKFSQDDTEHSIPTRRLSAESGDDVPFAWIKHIPEFGVPHGYIPEGWQHEPAEIESHGTPVTYDTEEFVEDSPAAGNGIIGVEYPLLKELPAFYGEDIRRIYHSRPMREDTPHGNVPSPQANDSPSETDSSGGPESPGYLHLGKIEGGGHLVPRPPLPPFAPKHARLPPV